MDKYKVMKMEEDNLEKELDAYKDYSKVLSSYKRLTFIKSVKFMSISSVTVIAAVSTVLYFAGQLDEIENTYEFENTTSENLQTNEPAPYKADFTYLDTIKIEPLEVEVEIKQQQIVTQKSEPKTNITPEFNFVKAFPGYSLDSVFQLFQKGLNAEAEKPISGTILIVMVIDDSGKVTDPKIITGLEPSFDSSILEYVQNLPNWSPAQLNSVPSSSTVTLPIEISINPDK